MASVGWWSEAFVEPAGIPSAEAFGGGGLSLAIRPTGIPSTEAFGAVRVTYLQDVSPTGIPSAEAFGTAAVGQTLTVSGIASAEAFGAAAAVVGPVTITPTGIASAEAFGTAGVGQRITPVGIASSEAFGVAKANLNVVASGIASGEAFGSATATRGPVTVTASGIASGEAFGSPIVTQPATVIYSTQGVGSENNGTPLSCSINPSTNDDVLAFATLGTSSGPTELFKATYGASNLPMTCVGQAVSNGVVIAAYIIRGVASGSATINITRGTSPAPWGQVVAVSYSGAAGYDPAAVAIGTGTSFSHSVTAPLNGRAVQALTTGDSGATLSSLAGGTSRYLDNSGFCIQSVRDTDVVVSPTAFTGTISSSRDWASIAVPLRTIAPTGVRAGYNIGTSSVLGATTTTVDVSAAVGDYVYTVVVQDRPGDPSSVTCAGTGMTLIDTAAWTSGSGSAFIKIYRSASTMGSAGAKTVSVVTTGSGWSRCFGIAVSGVSSPSGTVTKTSGTGSQPTQAVTCSAGQMILQVLGTSNTPTGFSGGSTLVAATSGQVFWSISISYSSATFSLSNTSANWGALAIVLS
ncbi:hypothetical protein [Mycobacteroides immunogenum]|uniref:hypothetical protein n=1 Tax=Mycobacteroides immunogenum TaxID=83262 RepID=UPI000A52E3DD|nr:hypothetical protein [Mycobacteroides immunogenum]